MAQRPWLYPFVEDPGGSRLRREVLRPLLQLMVQGPKDYATVYALVDSGCEHVLVAPWLERLTGITTDPNRYITLGIAGENLRVTFGSATLGLVPPDDVDAETCTWDCEVGVVQGWRASWAVVLGQVGFFDRFTVTMHRSAGATAVEAHETFDERFGILYESEP